MSTECKLLMACVIGFTLISLALIWNNNYMDLRITQMVNNGAHPIDARCALRDAGGANAICVIRTLKQGEK